MESVLGLEVFSGFNTQPPEGGCIDFIVAERLENVFQHTAARRRLRAILAGSIMAAQFQHTAARRRLPPAPSRGNP